MEYDLIVVGGGPGGTTLASIVAKQGHRVLLLERETFPRYQIGESTLPQTYGILRFIGALESVEAAGFVPKTGGVWYWGNETKPDNRVGLNFDNLPAAAKIGKAWAYQVDRARFDELLLRNAVRLGVEVREEHRVEGMIEEDGRIVGVRFTDKNGQAGQARARFVADAGGNTSPFHRLVGERVFAERFRNVAVFGYFRGGKRMPPPLSGSIMNVTFEKGWFWYIPISDTITSVGAVLSLEHAEVLKKGHETALLELIDSCPRIKDYLENAERVTEGRFGEVRVRKDWSYCNSRFWRPGLVLIGDAACFVDPLFSSGIHLSTYSALLAARSINTVLRGTVDEPTCFEEFEARYRAEFVTFIEFLTTFYDQSKTKEEYFRRARELVGGEENAELAFVQLVSGFSQDGPKRTSDPWSEKGRAFKDKDVGGRDFSGGAVELFALGRDETNGAAPVTGPAGSRLMPTADGGHWAAPGSPAAGA